MTSPTRPVSAVTSPSSTTRPASGVAPPRSRRSRSTRREPSWRRTSSAPCAWRRRSRQSCARTVAARWSTSCRCSPSSRCPKRRPTARRRPPRGRSPTRSAWSYVARGPSWSPCTPGSSTPTWPPASTPRRSAPRRSPPRSSPPSKPTPRRCSPTRPASGSRPHCPTTSPRSTQPCRRSGMQWRSADEHRDGHREMEGRTDPHRRRRRRQDRRARQRRHVPLLGQLLRDAAGQRALPDLGVGILDPPGRTGDHAGAAAGRRAQRPGRTARRPRRLRAGARRRWPYLRRRAPLLRHDRRRRRQLPHALAAGGASGRTRRRPLLPGAQRRRRRRPAPGTLRHRRRHQPDRPPDRRRARRRPAHRNRRHAALDRPGHGTLPYRLAGRRRCRPLLGCDLLVPPPTRRDHRGRPGPARPGGRGVSFAADTAVTRIGPGCFTADLHERWSSLVGIHGGYTAAIVANAMTAAVDDSTRALRSFATQFASIPRPGPVDIEVTVDRTGKSMTTTSARLVQEGRVLQVAHAASSTTRPGLAYDDHVRQRDADPGDTPRFESSGGVGHFQNADVRLDPDAILFGGRNEAWIAAWLRPLEGEPISAAWLVTMCDLLPPAVFSRTTGPVAAATIEYVVHLTTGDPSIAPGEYVYLSCRSPLSNEGFAVEDATMWAPDGRVLAVARQTRLAGA